MKYEKIVNLFEGMRNKEINTTIRRKIIIKAKAITGGVVVGVAVSLTLSMPLWAVEKNIQTEGRRIQK